MTTPIDHTQFGTLLELEGTAAQRPVVRTQPVGERGDPMPVLCLQIKGAGPSGTRSFTCNQVFPIGDYVGANARAATLKPGMRIKVQVALELMECHFPVTAHINAVKDQATQPQEAAHA